MSDRDPLPIFYAAITAIEEGKVAEVEMEHRSVSGEQETVLTITVRGEVKHFVYEQ